MNKSAKPEEVSELVGKNFGHLGDGGGEGSLGEQGKQGYHHITQCYDQAWNTDDQSELLVQIL